MNGLVYAQAQPAGPAASPLTAFLPLILVFFVFYFLLILPQQRKQKSHKKMLQELKRGDKVITVGGIVAEVEAIKDNIVTLKLGENTLVDFVRNAISQVLEKETTK